MVSSEVRLGMDSFGTGATTQVLTRHLAQTAFDAGYDVFPDGQRFVISSVRKGTMHAPLTLITNWTAELKKK